MLQVGLLNVRRCQVAGRVVELRDGAMLQVGLLNLEMVPCCRWGC